MTGDNDISYTDSAGQEYTETTTSPIAAVVRSEELTEAGYTVK